jgi:glycerol kinase
MTILAIDQGTTSTRGLEITNNGDRRIVDTIQIDQHYPSPGRVEHDPIQLIESIQRCLDQSPNATRVGIDNQGESCLAWDRRTGVPLSPVIVWQDSRTESVITKLKQAGVEELTLARAGLPLDSYFSATKLRWILENVAEAKPVLLAGHLGLGTTDAFFADRLCGRYITDITTASRTSLMNLESGQWDPELCEAFQIPIECLPKIVPTMGDIGTITSHPNKPILCTSVVDQQASLYGHGCRENGDIKMTFGTGAFALMVTGKSFYRKPEQGLLPTVAWQQQDHAATYALDGGVYCAGSALNWAKSLGLFKQWEEINQFDAAPAIQRELAFVPALSGLACPHWDRRAAGLWIGLSLDTQPADMLQAILEGIALRATEVISAMQKINNTGDSISIDGGLSVNPYFCQFLANALQKIVIVQKFPELTAMGTAQLAGYKTDIRLSSDTTIYEPNNRISDALDLFAEAVRRSQRWRSEF